MTYQHTSALSEQVDVVPDETQVDELFAVFQRVCDSLDIAADNELQARMVARAIIEAGLAGEEDPDGLFERARRPVLTS